MRRSPLDRLRPWPVRVAWLLLPVLAGPALADGLDDAGRTVQIVASAGMWAVWATVLVATLVPATTMLTAVRVATPAALAAVVIAVAADIAGGTDPAVWHAVGLCWATLAVGAAFAATTGATFVNGSSYGPELRTPLRVPGPLLLGPVQAAWSAVVLGATAGPLLLAAQQWIAGVAALAAGGPAAWWGIRALHTLARRWTVLVPGGLVLHDPLALADPVLLRRDNIASLGPAPADTDALDLTRGALGLAVEIRLRQPVPLVVTGTRRGGAAASVEAGAVLFAPTRPGAFLAAATQPSSGTLRRIG